MIEIKQLQVSIGGSRILRGVDLTVPSGAVTCLIGRNGVGKTTTLKSIIGILPPLSGVIQFNGKDLRRLSPDQRARMGIGYVPQGREIFPHLTVRENLVIGAIVHQKKISNQLDRVFELFPILKDFLGRPGGMLSGGQQQQLAIARVLITDPQVLILDEPTEGIQPNIIDQIGETIRLLRREGRMSILLVEQYLEFCRELADTFAIMDRGVIVSAGSVDQLSAAVVQEHLTL
ncbi:MAG: urea ABC transporter ATP-binding subunit UrtE [Armatimonadota bacterium]